MLSNQQVGLWACGPGDPPASLTPLTLKENHLSSHQNSRLTLSSFSAMVEIFQKNVSGLGYMGPKDCFLACFRQHEGSPEKV